MAKNTDEANVVERSLFDFTGAISQLLSVGGRDFAIRLVLWTAVLMGGVMALLAKPYLGFVGKLISASWEVNENPDNPEVIFEAYAGMGQYVLPMILATLAMWVIYAAAETALHKRAFRGEDYGNFPLHFGKDELRLMATQLTVFVTWYGAMIVLAIVASLLAGLAVVAASANVVLGLLVAVFATIAFVAFLIVPIYIGLRLTPSAALSVQRQRFAPFAGWGITYKRPAYLFLALLFLLIAGYTVMIVLQMALLGLVFPENGMLVMMGYSEQDPQEIFAQAAEKLKNPGVILGLVLGGIVYLLIMVAWWLTLCGVGLYAVKWWDKDAVVHAQNTN